MIIKKYIGKTEEEAIALAKAELGDNVTIMNTKEVVPRGLYKFFRKPSVEVTAAVDENIKESSAEPVKEEKKEDIPDFSKLQQVLNEKQFSPAPDSKTAQKEAERERMLKNSQIIEEELTEQQNGKDSGNDIEQKLNTLQDLLEKQMTMGREEEKEEKERAVDKNQAYLDLIRKQLIDNEVEESYVEQILEEIEGTLKNNSTLDNILASVYQKIVLKIGSPHLIDLKTKRTRYIFFIGPTGVGKTTTIAKIASVMKLAKKSKVALITSDTYRIAAVEQLKIYSNILGIPLKVVYAAEEMEKVREELRGFDLVLVDTAGRSHNNQGQKEDLNNILKTVPDSDKEIFLVLSATTKYKDLVKIANTYSEICKYNLIFTKLDETDTIGNIFNMHILTGAPLSYTTCGQNVPNDIGKIDAQKIAKQLLGGNS
ncbi:MAG: flagellar biosynthesis protein FlhF [Lachnospiraceae bacterium]|nr:flagellar biosynthesis protein FlhF [Lachnospiraceae bacterium]